MKLIARTLAEQTKHTATVRTQRGKRAAKKRKKSRTSESASDDLDWRDAAKAGSKHAPAQGD